MLVVRETFFVCIAVRGAKSDIEKCDDYLARTGSMLPHFLSLTRLSPPVQVLQTRRRLLLLQRTFTCSNSGQPFVEHCDYEQIMSNGLLIHDDGASIIFIGIQWIPLPNSFYPYQLLVLLFSSLALPHAYLPLDYVQRRRPRLLVLPMKPLIPDCSRSVLQLSNASLTLSRPPWEGGYVGGRDSRT